MTVPGCNSNTCAVIWLILCTGAGGSDAVNKFMQVFRWCRTIRDIRQDPIMRLPQVDMSRERLDFKWQLQPGGQEGAHYGLLLAQAVGFPEQVTPIQ